MRIRSGVLRRTRDYRREVRNGQSIWDGKACRRCPPSPIDLVGLHFASQLSTVCGCQPINVQSLSQDCAAAPQEAAQLTQARANRTTRRGAIAQTSRAMSGETKPLPPSLDDTVSCPEG
ncbi:hypothetical protein SKAU_G00005300 [Synaphobranchus kaupii]|uniref:Uncharacterized protein n=1 Tax=Synaphobranchus kaupii TaxID=118154 RepID=A0A9Q1JCT0_SYNKA|nr:hypothetical protein SKAU_G00005300 [Synaphobranchus kaupii]